MKTRTEFIIYGLCGVGAWVMHGDYGVQTFDAGSWYCFCIGLGVYFYARSIDQARNKSPHLTANISGSYGRWEEAGDYMIVPLDCIQMFGDITEGTERIAVYHKDLHDMNENNIIPPVHFIRQRFIEFDWIVRRKIVSRGWQQHKLYFGAIPTKGLAKDDIDEFVGKLSDRLDENRSFSKKDEVIEAMSVPVEEYVEHLARIDDRVKRKSMFSWTKSEPDEKKPE